MHLQNAFYYFETCRLNCKTWNLVLVVAMKKLVYKIFICKSIWNMLSCETFKFQVTKSKFNFLVDLMFWTASLQLRKLHKCFKHIPWPSFNCWNFVVCIECTSPLCNYANIVILLLVSNQPINVAWTYFFYSLPKLVWKWNHKYFSQGLWSSRELDLFLMFKCVKIGQGLNMLFNPPFKVALNEPQ
jgi:hypothetical protein